MTGLEQRQAQRFQELQRATCPYELMNELYGIPVQVPVEIKRGIAAWQATMRRNREVLYPERVNRHELETFLQNTDVMPIKWASLQLGMKPDSFECVLDALDKKNRLIRTPYAISRYLIDRRFMERFFELFRDLRSTVFSDHNTYCSRLHQAIETDLGVQVDPWHCITSKELGEDPPDFAHDLDVITLDPVGLRYQIWLDFKKPLNLRPDACSMLFYARERELIEPHVFGGRPVELPSALVSWA